MGAETTTSEKAPQVSDAARGLQQGLYGLESGLEWLKREQRQLATLVRRLSTAEERGKKPSAHLLQEVARVQRSLKRASELYLARVQSMDEHAQALG